MKYWLYLAAKLLVAFGVFYGLLYLAAYLLPVPPKPRYGVEPPVLHDMPVTFAVLFDFLIGAGLVYLAIWDQRRRCRTCLRRLIMPISTGSWSNMLVFGRPKDEWICPYGHGTLRISSLQITGAELPDWEPHQDMWRELESYDHSNK